MDKVAASGAADTGSIPVWDAKVKKLAIAGFFFISTQESCPRIVPGTKINLLSVTASQSVDATLKLIIFITLSRALLAVD